MGKLSGTRDEPRDKKANVGGPHDNIYTYQLNVKVKFTLEQTTKTQSGSRSIAILLL